MSAEVESIAPPEEEVEDVPAVNPQPKIEEIDLNSLLTFSLTFEPLKLVLQSLMDRNRELHDRVQRQLGDEASEGPSLLERLAKLEANAAVSGDGGADRDEEAKEEEAVEGGEEVEESKEAEKEENEEENAEGGDNSADAEASDANAAKSGDEKGDGVDSSAEKEGGGENDVLKSLQDEISKLRARVDELERRPVADGGVPVAAVDVGSEKPSESGDGARAASEAKGLAGEAKGLADEAKGVAGEAKGLADEAKGLAGEAKGVADEAKNLAGEAKEGLGRLEPRVSQLETGAFRQPVAKGDDVGSVPRTSGEDISGLSSLERRVRALEERLKAGTFSLEGPSNANQPQKLADEQEEEEDDGDLRERVRSLGTSVDGAVADDVGANRAAGRSMVASLRSRSRPGSAVSRPRSREGSPSAAMLENGAEGRVAQEALRRANEAEAEVQRLNRVLDELSVRTEEGRNDLSRRGDDFERALKSLRRDIANLSSTAATGEDDEEADPQKRPPSAASTARGRPSSPARSLSPGPRSEQWRDEMEARVGAAETAADEAARRARMAEDTVASIRRRVAELSSSNSGGGGGQSFGGEVSSSSTTEKSKPPSSSSSSPWNDEIANLREESAASRTLVAGLLRVVDRLCRQQAIVAGVSADKVASAAVAAALSTPSSSAAAAAAARDGAASAPSHGQGDGSPATAGALALGLESRRQAAAAAGVDDDGMGAGSGEPGSSRFIQQTSNALKAVDALVADIEAAAQAKADSSEVALLRRRMGEAEASARDAMEALERSERKLEQRLAAAVSGHLGASAASLGGLGMDGQDGTNAGVGGADAEALWEALDSKLDKQLVRGLARSSELDAKADRQDLDALRSLLRRLRSEVDLILRSRNESDWAFLAGRPLRSFHCLSCGADMAPDAVPKVERLPAPGVHAHRPPSRVRSAIERDEAKLEARTPNARPPSASNNNHRVGFAPVSTRTVRTPEQRYVTASSSSRTFVDAAATPDKPKTQSQARAASPQPNNSSFLPAIHSESKAP